MKIKSLTAGVAAAALVSTLGLAYAQNAVLPSDSSPAVATPIDGQRSMDSSSSPTYSSSDTSTSPSSAASTSPSADSYSSEPAPQADRN